MSFRNTYITDFIYQASAETIGANEDLRKIFQEFSRFTYTEVGERGMGCFAGILSTLDGSIEQTGVTNLVYRLKKATKVPFRLTVMMESGPVMTFDIKP